VSERAPIDLAVPRSLRQILGAALRLYARYPWLFLILALAVIAPFDLAVLAVTGNGPLTRGHESFASSLTLSLLRTTLVAGLIAAVHLHAVVMIGRGERPRLAVVAVRGLRVLPVVTATEVVATVLTFVGFLLIVIPGVIALLMLAVAAQAAALEDKGWIGALRSSRDLTDGHWGHVFALIVVQGLIGLAALLVSRALPLGSSTGAASVATGIAVNAAAASFGALTLALLYFDLIARLAARSEQPAGVA
jgi:hypothetical protein